MKNNSEEDLNIAQITDTHLTKDDHEGTVNYERLKRVINHVSEDDYDFVLVTGDISDDGSFQSYQSFDNLCALLTCPVYCITGNHDEVNNLNAYCNKSKNLTFFERAIVTENFIFIKLDTILPGKDYGYVTENEVKLVNQVMETYGSKKICLVMHHQPCPVGTLNIDDHMLTNYKLVNQLINEYDNISMIIFGHVHNDYELKLGNDVVASSAPATCYQMIKSTNETQFDYTKIGYKYYRFNPNTLSFNRQCIWLSSEIN